MLPFENVFTLSETYASFILSLVLFPVVNNYVHCRDYGSPKRFYLTVSLPRYLGIIILLFPRKHLGYRVHLFCFISECVFVILLGVFVCFSLFDIQLPETIQTVLPRCMCGFVFAAACGAVIDSIVYDKRHHQ